MCAISLRKAPAPLTPKGSASAVGQDAVDSWCPPAPGSVHGAAGLSVSLLRNPEFYARPTAGATSQARLDRLSPHRFRLSPGVLGAAIRFWLKCALVDPR
jgi:hypothetical protein